MVLNVFTICGLTSARLLDLIHCKDSRVSMSLQCLRPVGQFHDCVLGLQFVTVAGFDVNDHTQQGVALDSCIDLPKPVRGYMKKQRLPGLAYGVSVATALLGEEVVGLRSWLNQQRILFVLILNPIGEAALTTNLATWAAKVGFMAPCLYCTVFLRSCRARCVRECLLRTVVFFAEPS